ncbi:Cyanovirin-N [Leucogyrophana mollusca]|uniref:Cyanovirin-N n=1 Tax=Leucogyrophana mollusca TaxID=85980 RepID=A0ACB8BCZ5_9AGAM|nr:Cyanovirin-N [Leucogyrophana mollusca]
MRFVPVQTFLSGLTVLCIAPSVVLATGDFSRSCPDYSVRGAILYAVCRRVDGSQVTTQLDLDHCLENGNGKLVCRQNGAYASSCSACSFSGTTLSCQCRDEESHPQYTSIDLDQCVGNSNGNLVC